MLPLFRAAMTGHCPTLTFCKLFLRTPTQFEKRKRVKTLPLDLSEFSMVGARVSRKTKREKDFQILQFGRATNALFRRGDLG
jgi:hypothetical protein